MPEWLKGTDCKSVAVGYDGSNPSLPTIFFLINFKTFIKCLKKCLTREIIKDILNKLTYEARASEKVRVFFEN